MDQWTIPVVILAAPAMLAHGITSLVCAYQLPLAAAVVGAIVWTAVQFVVTIVAAWIVLFMTRETMPRGRMMAFAALGAWFAPVGLLLSKQSWGLVLAAGFVAVALKHFGSEPPGEPSGRFLEGMALQSAAVAMVLSSVSMTALCAGVLLYRLVRHNTRGVGARRWVTALAAVVLTAIGLSPLSRPAPTGNAAGQNAAHHERDDDDLLTGVILKSKLTNVTIVAPPRAKLAKGLGMARDLIIPFSGVYWIFSWPSPAPPKSSMVDVADATEYNFHGPPSMVLRMEARQTIATPIDIRCCSRIDMNITNTDKLPNTVSLELWLRNRSDGNLRGQSLGRVAVVGQEPLRFVVPQKAGIQKFDELVVEYRMTYPRRHRSANVAIRSFTLVPAGG